MVCLLARLISADSERTINCTDKNINIDYKNDIFGWSTGISFFLTNKIQPSILLFWPVDSMLIL